MASKIDLFNHVMPQAYLELVKAHSKEPGMVKRMSSLRMLWDIEHRVEMLRSRFPDVQQVLTLGLPSPELLGGPELSPGFARVANDGMAAMVADPSDDAETVLDREDRGKVIRKCLTRLSPLHREIIDLVYYHEKSVDEVAQIVGAPKSTVKTRMFYARNHMSKLLTAVGVTGT